MSSFRPKPCAVWALAALGSLALGVRPGSAQEKLSELDFLLLGLSVAPEPEVQAVPRNTATGLIVAVRFADSGADPALLLSLLPPGLEVAAEIVGPGLDAPIPLRGRPGGLLPIPPLTSRGLYLVRDIRLEIDGEPYLRASPDTATVEVIDQVLVTQVTTRPLTREELAQKGILFGEDSFTAFNFRLALRLDSRPVEIDLSVVFDSQNVPVPLRQTGGIGVTGPGLPVVNTGVTPVMMTPDVAAIDQDVLENLPADIRIPGLLVVPGEVGFLNQFFSGLLLVSNGAPPGSNLIVSALTGEVVLPLGDDAVPDSGDEPLVLAVTEGGPPQGERVAEIRGVGLDGVPGTADDPVRFGPGQQGQAEYLFEGKLEGFHEIRFDLHGTLEGLPVGPIPISGVARGGVLVRNPDFQLTFSAPATVRAQEEFTLYITVTNVSRANAPLVRVALGGGVSGAALAVGEPEVREIDDLGAGESEVLPYRFVATQTGQVTASYLRVEGGTGNLLFRMGVGERGVPLSPDTIVLPTTVAALASPAEKAVSAPPRVVQAATRVLGLAWSTATAPEGTLPEGVTRLSKGVVLDRATELAEAGFRVELGESLERTLVDLALSWVGAKDPGFEELLRDTAAGRAFLAAVGATLSEIPSVPIDVAELHRALADAFSSREQHLLMGTSGGATLRVTGPEGELGSTLPRAGFLPIGASRDLAILPRLSGSRYVVELASSDTAASDLVLNVPFVGGGTGVYRFEGVALSPGLVARLALDLRTSPGRLTLSLVRGGVIEGTVDSAPVEFFAPRGPQLLAATVIGPETLNGADPWGRLLAVLFDREVRAAEAERIASYAVEENEVLSALRQISGRLVFLFLRDPLGNFVPRTASASRLFDPTGKPMTPLTQSAAVVSRILDPGAVVSGRVLNADGTPVPTAEVLYMNSTGANLIGLSLKPVAADGSYGFDYVRRGDTGGSFAIRARDTATGAIQELATRVSTNGEHLRVDLVLRGRGGVEGFVTDLGGGPRPGARVLVTSQADPTSFALTKANGDGYYRAPGLVVGPVSVKAVDGVFSGVAAGSLLRAGTFARVDVTLNAGSGRVHGRVLELAEGMVQDALSNVDVYFVTADDLVASSTKTNASGAYLFENVPTGSFRVVAVDLVTGRQTSSLLQSLDAGGDLAVDVFFELEAAGTLRGTVSTEAGPIVGAIVSAAGRQVATVDTGSGPEFVIENVPVGTHLVSASLPGTNRIARANVSVAFGATRSVDLRLSGTGQVRVTVLDNAGNSVGEGQQVLRVSGSNPCAGESALTDVGGVAVFSGVTVPGATFKATRGGDVAVGQAILTREGETALLTLRFKGFGTVFGQVSDENGPVLGADVALGALRFDSRLCAYVSDGRARQLRTNSLGQYRFENVPVGNVTVTGTAGTGTSLPATAKAALLANGDSRELNLTLTDNLGGAITGVVVLPDGKTPAGAGVRVTTTSNIGAEITVTTDTAGKYAFAKILAPGRYTLTASDPLTGRVARSTVFLQLEQDLAANLRLLGRGAVEVTVKDGSGALASEAFVELEGASYPFDARAGAIVPSDHGVLRFERVSEGEFTVSATADGRGGRATGTVSGEGTTTRVNVTLTSVGRLVGVLRSPDGATGVPNAEILVKQGSTGRLLGATTTSSVTLAFPDVCKSAFGNEGLGYFELGSVPAGSLLVTATDPLTGRIGEASSSIAADGQTACVEVRLLGLGTVTGTVRDGASLVPGASVTVTSSTGLSGAVANLKAEATTNGEGAFRFEGLPVGSFTVKATLPGALLTGTETGAITKEGDVVDVDVQLEPSGTLRGTVFEADGVTPVPRALVTLRPSKGLLRAESNANGTFSFDLVPAGGFTLTAEENGGFDGGRLEGTLAGGELLEGLELRFNGTGGIEGTARDASDALLATGLVRLTTPAPFARSETSTVDAAGSFRFLEVPVGPFELSLEVAGSPLRGFTSGDVLLDDTVSVVLKLEEARPVVGRVLRDDGTTPAPNVPVTLKGSGFTLGDLTDAAGSFRIDGVPLGSFTLEARDALTGGIAIAAGLLEETTPDAGLDVGDLLLDATPIELVATTPANGATLVAPDAAIDVVFSDPVGNASLVGLLNVTANGSPVAGARELADERTGRFTATPFLPPSAAVTVTVSGSLKDVFGRTLGEDVTVSFTTGGAVVTGLVTNFGAPVAGAAVQLTAGAETLATVTDPAGRYRFENVPAGSASLLVTSGALAGGAVLDIGPADGVVLADVALSVVGSVTGNVAEWNGAAAPEGLVVRVFQLGELVGLTNTDATGSYRVDNVPLGDVIVDVTNEVNGDRGQGAGTLVEAGVAAVVDVTLLGVGSVEIAVEDSLAAPVEGATVALSFTRFGTRTDLSGTTSAAGSVVFDNVVAGSVSATAQALELTSSDNFTATVDPDRFVITLQALGGLDGVVRAPGGVTPVSGAAVAIYRDAGNVLLDSAVSAADGTFSFRDLPAIGAAYRVDVEVNGQLRARERGVSIPANAVGSIELTLVQVGTVQGSLSAPVALSASTTVKLQSFAPEVGRTVQVSAVGNGYQIDDVPAGAFTITARDSVNGLLGEASGTMPPGGGAVVVDVALLANTTTIPTSGLRLTEANGVNFRVQRSGASTEGAGNLFSAFAGSGGLFLDVTVGGVTTRYAGGSLGLLEESGREIVTATETLGGLEVQRKVYVPADGYFARYLEIVDNPSDAPVDVELALVSDINRGNGTTSIVDASGGWVLVDDGADSDPFESFGTLPSVAFVTGALASAEPLADGPSANQKRLTLRTPVITVPAGGRVVLLHFVAQQLSREAGRAASERLVALPPEALVGLDADEAAAVVNFAVPVDGSSLVPPLPTRNGSVSGALSGLTSKGETRPVGTASGIGSLNVELQSDHVLFRRIWKKSTATGALAFAAPEIAIPRVGFHLRAFKTLGGTTTEASLDGGFTGSALVSHAPDASFEATSAFGSQVGERVLDGNAATDWRPATTDTDPRLTWSLATPVSVETIVVTPHATASLGTLEIVLDGVAQTHAFETPAGELRVALDPPVEASTIALGFTGSLVRVAEVAILGTTAIDIGSSWRDIVFTASGAVELSVEAASGDPAPATVTAKVGTLFLSNLAAPEGELYLGPLAPEAGVSLTAVRSGVGHPFQQATVSSVALVAGTATPVPLTLPLGTTLSGRVTDASGAGLGGKSMTVFGPNSTQTNVTTDATGVYSLSEVPSGDYTVRVIHAGVTLNVPVSVAAPTPAVKDIQFYAPGTVNVEVRYESGDASVRLATGAAVTLVDALSGARTLYTPSTGASAGRVSFTNLPPGEFTLSIPHPTNPASVTTDAGTLPSGGTVTLTTFLPAFGTIVADVDLAGGAPANGATVEISGSGVSHAPRTVVSGTASFTNVPGLTPVTVLARHPAAGRSHITTQQSVTLLNQGESLTVPLALPVTGDVVVSVTEEGTGAGVAGVSVFVKDAFSADFRAEGPTDATGERLVPVVPEGAFTVRVERGGVVVGETASSMAADGLPVTVAFTVPTDASIEGFVFAGDGATPVAAARVELRSEDGATLLEQTTAANDGSYRFDAALAPGASALVRALYPADTSKRAEQVVTANAAGDLIALDLVLPVSVIEGRVLEPGGVVPVEGAAVGLRAYGRLSVRTTTSDAAGRFVFLGEAPGVVELVAEDVSGLSVFASGELVAIDEPLALDLVLPEHGSVEVSVLDESALPVSGSVLVLRSGALRAPLAKLSDPDGVYRFDRVPFGAFSVHYDDAGTRSGFAVGELSGAAPVATLTVELPGFTAVYGNLTESGLPVVPLDEFVPVTVESRLQETESGVPSRSGSAAVATGEYRIESVPAGEVTVTVRDLGTTGAATASVTADLPEHRIDVERGSALDFPVPLGAAFDVDPDGAAFALGTLANIVSVNAKAYPFLGSATPDPSDAGQVVLGPVRASGLLHTRDLYAPAGQKFVRYLEVFVNPHAVDVAITVDLEGDLVSVAPLAPGEGTLVDGAIAHVFTGATAGALPPSFAGSESGYGSAATWRKLVVPAGGRVVLLHFLVAASDETEARALADSLSSLTHPNALDALEPGLGADVVNFEIP